MQACPGEGEEREKVGGGGHYIMAARDAMGTIRIIYNKENKPTRATTSNM